MVQRSGGACIVNPNRSTTRNPRVLLTWLTYRRRPTPAVVHDSAWKILAVVGKTLTSRHHLVPSFLAFHISSLAGFHTISLVDFHITSLVDFRCMYPPPQPGCWRCRSERRAVGLDEPDFWHSKAVQNGMQPRLPGTPATMVRSGCRADRGPMPTRTRLGLANRVIYLADRVIYLDSRVIYLADG